MSLLTKFNLKYVVILIIQWSHLLGGCPFKWDSRKYGVSISKDKWSVWKWRLFVIGNISYEMYALSRGLYEYTVNRNITASFLCFLASVIGVCFLASIFAMHFNMEEITLTFNYSINFMFRNKASLFAQQNLESELFQLIFPWMFSAWMFIWPILGAMILILFPHWPIFPTSLLISSSENISHNLLIYFSVGIPFVSLFFAVFSHVWFQFVCLTVNILSGCFLLKNSKLYSKKHNAKDELRSASHIRQTYTILTIQINMLNDIYKYMFYIVQFSLKRGIYLSNYCWIRKSAELGVFVTVVIFFVAVFESLVWCFVLWLSSLVNDESKSCIDSWKRFQASNDGETKELKKFAIACIPLKVHKADFSFVQKRNVLTFLHTICKGTMEMLLTIP